ncbi:magnesium and cobalt transport protein CorA [Streptomyces parvulus]|uniref:Magnesium and cobalt transport protein CorA n=1 Tax=Streptomyces parvulus TaxID=146923 RepID=A0ABV5DGZ0_9ACTN|nr:MULTISPECIES: magnesium and cobalt transport protein CorA [Streptomyces]MCC9157247.1 magnesium and cobalt transport protein CorA [Streptomyces parvulus]MCE7688963.1 magnesium and cobalt transport protein CorA [Streptomyces parvulus]MCQ4197048.1 magnesium and cobalt transport protein CorA [Streptomyces parvulus]MZD58333.1 magnesium transporter CorA [Streptomyces sp. SID5606]WHM33527.1 magnesium and cobalt transport protein CorA [Streptomyces sp. BPPL-273]
MTMAGNLRKVTGLGKVGGLRKVARLGRRRRRVDLSHPARSPLGSSVVNCVTYRDGIRTPEGGDPVEVVTRMRRRGAGFVWLGLHEPTDQEFAGVAELFDLHPLAVEDAIEAHQRPKVERYGDTLFAVFKTVCYVEHEELTATSEVVSTGEIMVFVGEDFAITVRHGRHGSLGPLREELESDPGQLAKGPSAVLHAIADHVVDDFLHVIESVQADVDHVETEVFAEHGARVDPGRIYQLKRELLELRRAVVPLGRPLEELATRPFRVVDQEIQAYFRDVSDHLLRATEQIAAFDELLNSILQAHLARVTVAQNEDMRKITAWAAIVAVPTMVCGVYGMNFDHMPELRWRYGYGLVIGVIAVACLALHRGFRRNGWL